MLATIASHLEQLWYVPINLSTRPDAWAAPYWWLRSALLAPRPLRRHELQLDGRLVTIVTAGRPKRCMELCTALLGAPPGPALPLVESPASQHPSDLGCMEADLIAVETHPGAAVAYRRAGWIVVPGWVRWRGELARIPPNSRSLNSDLNKVRRHGYRLERARGSADWREFLTRMVIPYAVQQFGESAWVPAGPFPRLVRRLGALHFVCRGGERVAGFLAVARGRHAWFPMLGALPDAQLRREGVLAAVYAFTFEWARAAGYASVDLGRSSAFAADGVGRYKAKWGLEPTPDLMSHMVALRPGPAVREAFARTPVRILAEDGVGVYAGTG